MSHKAACRILFWSCALLSIGSVALMLHPLDDGDHDYSVFAQIEALLAVAFAVAGSRR